MSGRKLLDFSEKEVNIYVLHVDEPQVQPMAGRTLEQRLHEAVNLTEALRGIHVIGTEALRLQAINPKTFIGGGKVEELVERKQANSFDVLLVNVQLSPRQQRNLELAIGCKVIDRTGLILEIFAERARTKAGRLQVELAQLHYQQSRLVRTWTHLERQRGGLGKTGGPGERQIELDRRMIRDRMTQIKNDLKRVEQERGLHRRARERAGMPVVALVGYTNAGKSTLFNALVGEDETMAKNQLFATLDPLMRKVKLASGLEIILADTVGFVADLPHELVESFKATLEEVSSSDLILHVKDVSAEDAEAQEADVLEVLESIGAQKVARLDVGNKVDLLPEGQALGLGVIGVSGMTGQGVERLCAAIDEHFRATQNEYELQIEASDGKQMAWLHQNGEVVGQDLVEDKWQVRALMSPATFERYCSIFKKDEKAS